MKTISQYSKLCEGTEKLKSTYYNIKIKYLAQLLFSDRNVLW